MKKEEKNYIDVLEINPGAIVFIFILMLILSIFGFYMLNKDSEEFMDQCMSRGYSESHCRSQL